MTKRTTKAVLKSPAYSLESLRQSLNQFHERLADKIQTAYENRDDLMIKRIVNALREKLKP